MSDSTSLLSTLSQSSAVMVAIIGGFLVSKLVSVSSEKEALKRQLKSAKQKLAHIKPAYESAHKYRLNNSKSTFYGWVLDDLVKSGLNDVDYESLTSDNIPRGSSIDEMLPYAQTLHERIKSAHQKLSPLLQGQYAGSGLDLDDLKKQGLKVPKTDEDIYEEVFHNLRSKLPEKPIPTIMGIPIPQVSGISLGPIVLAKPAWTHEVDARRLDESIREEQNLKEQLATVESEIDRLTYDLAKLGKPVGVISAVWILALLSLLGIVLPVLVMAAEPMKLTWELKTLLIGSFIAGLIAVLGYIVWYLKKINN